MSKTVYLHVGLPKTGTTYLQSYFHVNSAGLRAQGVEYAGGVGQPVQKLAVWDLRGRRPKGHKDARVSGQWEMLSRHILDSPAPAGLISQEGLTLASLREARRAVASFEGAEVKVIVTARDLGRVLVSFWQEEIKGEGTWTWREYADAIKDSDQATKKPGFGFWRREDLVRVCDTWAAAVGMERLHLVTVPPSGSDPSELLRRTASVVGFDPGLLTEKPGAGNEMVGVAGIEVLRQVNERLGGRLNEAQHARAIRGSLVTMLARPASQQKAGLPESELKWVEEKADAMIATVRSRGYRVIGDLDDLRPRSEAGVRAPDDATDAELYEAAMDALAQLTETYATSWWSRRRRRVEDLPELDDRASRWRRRAYAMKIKALELSHRNGLAAKAMSVLLRGEARRLERARDRT